MITAGIKTAQKSHGGHCHGGTRRAASGLATLCNGGPTEAAGAAPRKRAQGRAFARFAPSESQGTLQRGATGAPAHRSVAPDCSDVARRGAGHRPETLSCGRRKGLMWHGCADVARLC